jgi:hypothetical protein
MESIWVCIDPSPTETRVLALAGPGATLLKARLSPLPRHARGPAALLEALALWQGMPVRAALCVDDPGAGSGWDSLGLEAGGPPLFTLEGVHRRRTYRRRDGLSGLGDFADLGQLLLFEVAR